MDETQVAAEEERHVAEHVREPRVVYFVMACRHPFPLCELQLGIELRLEAILSIFRIDIIDHHRPAGDEEVPLALQILHMDPRIQVDGDWLKALETRIAVVHDEVVVAVLQSVLGEDNRAACEGQPYLQQQGATQVEVLD